MIFFILLWSFTALYGPVRGQSTWPYSTSQGVKRTKKDYRDEQNECARTTKRHRQMKTCGGNPGAISCTAEAECRGSLHKRALAGDNACEKKKECKWSEEISSIFHLLKCHTFILQYSFYIIFKSPREHTMSCSLHNDLGLYLLFFVILDMSIDLSVILLFIIIIYFSSLHLLL